MSDPIVVDSPLSRRAKRAPPKIECAPTKTEGAAPKPKKKPSERWDKVKRWLLAILAIALAQGCRRSLRDRVALGTPYRPPGRHCHRIARRRDPVTVHAGDEGRGTPARSAEFMPERANWSTSRGGIQGHKPLTGHVHGVDDRSLRRRPGTAE